jgi:beta-phosphoglucomutase
MVDAQARAATYAERKPQLIERLIDAGRFMAFDDAVRFVLALEKRHFRMAVASSSKNAVRMLRQIDVAQPDAHMDANKSRGRSLLDLFQSNMCGRDLPADKPDPTIFLLAAHEPGVHPSRCLVIKDAPSGVEAARNAGMRAIGVARLHDEALLHAAGADLVVHTLDDVSLDELQAGRVQSTTALSAGA